MFASATHSALRPTLSALAFFLPLGVALGAQAAESCGEESCPKGFVCEMVPAPCPEIACVEGSCPPCGASVPACRPASCQSDSDCGDGMACSERRYDCGAVAPACVGDDCPTTNDEPSCAPTVEKLCVPRWQLPCNADADCGEGFSCVEREACSCPGSPGGGSGSSGSATPTEPAPNDSAPAREKAAGSEPGASAPDGCSCEPSGVKACEPRTVACVSDADCAAGWSCGDNPNGSCWANSDGEMGCTPADPPKLCIPPYSGVSDGGYGEATSGNDAPSSGNPETASEAPPRASGGGGCSVAAPGASFAGAALFGFVAAALGLLRRRKSAG